MFYNGNEHLMNTWKTNQNKKKKIKATLKSQDFLSAQMKLNSKQNLKTAVVDYS